LHARVREKGGYRHANGQESINLKSGCRIAFKARTKSGARGWSGDLLVWNEAMIIPEAVVGSQKPSIRASQAPYGQKTIYAGSAVDYLVHEHGVPFALIRERGKEKNSRVSWHEWGAPFDDPADMHADVLQDRSWWPVANPSMPEGLILEQTMQDEIDTMPGRTVAVELANVGDWPATDGSDDYVIHINAWDALRDLESQLQEPFVLGFDVSPERRSSIVLVGRNQNGLFHVEVQEHRPGTDWLVARIIEMFETGRVEVVVCDGIGPAASMVQALRDSGLPVTTVNSAEHGQACGRLVDMVAEGAVVHLGSDELRDAIRGARSRPLGDAWAWSRKSSAVDISPLVASTLALGHASGVGAELQVF
jgi:predicted Fe-Mo cluster-binding NifX family protein